MLLLYRGALLHISETNVNGYTLTKAKQPKLGGSARNQKWLKNKQEKVPLLSVVKKIPSQWK